MWGPPIRKAKKKKEKKKKKKKNQKKTKQTQPTPQDKKKKKKKKKNHPNQPKKRKKKKKKNLGAGAVTTDEERDYRGWKEPRAKRTTRGFRCEQYWELGRVSGGRET